MTRFTNKTCNVLTNYTLPTIYNRVVHFQPRNEITSDELLKVFVRPEHQEMLSTVSKIAHINAYAQAISTMQDGVTITYTMRDKVFVVPNYAGQYADKECDEYELLVEKTHRWMAWGRKAGTDYHTLSSVVSGLRQQCGTLEQVRFFFPGIVHLLAMCEDTKELADQVREPTSPKTLPKLRSGFGQMCKDATTFISRVALFPAVENHPREHEQVLLKMGSFKVELPTGQTTIVNL